MSTNESLLSTSSLSLLAGLGLIIAGCAPPSPPPPAPSAIQIFNPANGFQFLSEASASFNLNGLNNYASYIASICYRVDRTGSEVPAAIAGGLCDTGSTEYIGNPIAISCDDPDGGLEDHTVSIVFGYNNGDTPASIENRSVGYTIDCTIPDYAFDIGVELALTGYAAGGGSGTGYGIFDPVSGNLTYSFDIETTTAFTWATTTANEVLSGIFNDPILSSVTGQSQTYSCTDHGGLVDQCTQINNGDIPTPFAPMSITSGNTILISEVGGDFQVETVVPQLAGTAFETIATTTYTFTRTSVSHAIGGTVTGLDSVPGGTLQLQINGDTTLDLTVDGNYNFPRQADETVYDVQIISEPDDVNYACTFNNPNNSGVLASEDVTDINITCTCSSTMEGDWSWVAVLNEPECENVVLPVPNDTVFTFDANGTNQLGLTSVQNGCSVELFWTITNSGTLVTQDWYFHGEMSYDSQTVGGDMLIEFSNENPDIPGCFEYARLP